MNILKTSRCVLSPMTEADKADYSVLCNDKLVWEYLGGTSTAERSMDNIGRMLNPMDNEYYWVIRNSTNEEFIGLISLTPHHNKSDTELSYMLLSKHWGKGFAKEVSKEIIRFAFEILRLDKIVAETQIKNIKSRKLLEKLGFSEALKLVRYNEEQIIYWLSFS